jgi:tRNA A37 methylthiotransferase MiaB
MKTVFIDSVGCTENILDGAIFRNIALANGYTPAHRPEDADLIIYNTCAYKEKQEDLCIEAIKKYQALQKDGTRLVVTGCLVGINKERLDQIFSGFSFPPTDLIQIYDAVEASRPDRIEDAHQIPREISDSEMFRTRALLERIYSVKRFFKKRLRIEFLPNFNYFDYIGDDTTVYVRISRGCLNNCGYCAIKFAQGTLQSVPVESIISTIEQGVSEGYKKVFLIGTNTSHYGKDIGTSFLDLLERILTLDGDFKIMVHNFEPFGVQEDPERFVRLFSSTKMLSFYFPIQSASQSVLRKMRRNYDIARVMETMHELKNMNKPLLIRSEFIVGYPGESWKDFFETVSACRSFEFDQIDLHCYSPRPNTYAAGLQHHVPLLTSYIRFCLIHVLVFFNTTLRKLRPF